jgi:putative ABC transport system permease protein
MALFLYPNYIREISVRIMPGDIRKTLNFIQTKWEGTFPGEQFEYSFLDSRINQLYASEKKMQNIFIIFSFLSILVACLGLFGLVSFTAELKIKEIGIRKVLGASTGSVVLLLSKEFIKWIIIANIVAWPIAWFMMSKWLQNFAYRENIGWVIFLLSGFITMLIAIFTFIFQTVKTACANPADSLRYE